MQGLFKSGYEDLKSLSPLFQYTMPLALFLFLLTYLRFDDVTTRPEKVKTEILTIIFKLFEQFITNFKENHTSKSNFTIDEIPVPFRRRLFSYIPSQQIS